MTRIDKHPNDDRDKRSRAHKGTAGVWQLQDAKARFSELVRRVHSEGPQRVTVRGRDEVIVMSADQYRRLEGAQTGAALVAVMQASPFRDLAIEPKRSRMPVRDVDL